MKNKANAATNGAAEKTMPEIKTGLNGASKDTKKGAEVAATTLKVENEPKQVGDLIEQIRHKAKLVSDLQATIDRRQQLQKLYSEDKIKIAIKPIDYTGRRDDLEFFNENIIDYIVKNLIEKSKEVESDIAAKLFELEK
jgi:hypothetical protein